MGKTLSLVALAGTLSAGITGAADFELSIRLLNNAGNGRDAFFTPGNDYYVGLRLQSKTGGIPFSGVDYIRWDVGDINGATISQVFAPSPLYFFQDYFLGREIDSKTNRVDATGGERAALPS